MSTAGRAPVVRVARAAAAWDARRVHVREQVPRAELEAQTEAVVDRVRPGLSPERVLAMQRGAGNAAVTRMLSRPMLQREVPSGTDYQAARAAKEEWVRGGVRGPEDYVASTNRGGFQVAYVPSVGHGALNITLKGAVRFVNGIDLLFGAIPIAIAKQPSPQVQAAATAINALPIDQRAAAVAPWQWNGGDETQFLEDFRTCVRDAWHRRFQFHNTREYWGDLGADVNVFVDVHSGAKAEGDHMSLTTYKIASGAAAGTVGVVRSRAGRDAHDNAMELNSTDVRPRTDISLTRTVGFDAGTDTIDAAGSATVLDFATRFQSAGGPLCGTCGEEIRELAGTRINIHVQGHGADVQGMARTRFDKIVAALAAGGMADTATRCVFHFDGVGDRARLLVGDGQRQVVAAHEAGHMFGLEDEYTAPFTSSSAGALGAQTDPGLGSAQGLPGAVRENTDSIMSVGNAVKPQHYATFLEALKHVTAMEDWAFGAPTGVVPPGVDGPLPRPPGQPAEPETAYA